MKTLGLWLLFVSSISVLSGSTQSFADEWCGKKGCKPPVGPPAPVCSVGLPSVSYAQTLFNFTPNLAISPITPTVANVSKLTITPVLPAGLSFDAATGAITGTPTENTSQIYTINAFNSCGQSSSAAINIIVSPVP